MGACPRVHSTHCWQPKDDCHPTRERFFSLSTATDCVAIYRARFILIHGIQNCGIADMSALRSVSASEIEALLDTRMEQYLECVKNTFVEYSNGEATNPLRSWLETGPNEGSIFENVFQRSHFELDE